MITRIFFLIFALMLFLTASAGCGGTDMPKDSPENAPTVKDTPVNAPDYSDFVMPEETDKLVIWSDDTEADTPKPFPCSGSSTRTWALSGRSTIRTSMSCVFGVSLPQGEARISFTESRTTCPTYTKP